MKKIILPFIDKDIENIEDVSYLDGKSQTYGHQSFETIKKCAIYDTIKNYTFFTILRNPIELLISHYNYAHINKFHYLHDFVEQNNFEKYVTRMYEEDFHQYYNFHFLTDNNVINKNICIIRYDNILEDLKAFFVKQNVEKNVDELDNLIKIKVNESTHIINKSNIVDYLNDDDNSIIKLFSSEHMIKDMLFYYSVN